MQGWPQLCRRIAAAPEGDTGVIILRDIAQHMAAGGRGNALDIEEKQADAVPWYHRMLYHRLENAKSFWITPDWEVQIADIADVSLRMIGRGDGSNSKSATAMEFVLNLTALLLMVNLLDLSSSSSAELLVRRTLQFPKAVRKKLAFPEFAFLEAYMQHCHYLGRGLQTTIFEKDESAGKKQAMLNKVEIDARESEGGGKNKIKKKFAAAEAGES